MPVSAGDVVTQILAYPVGQIGAGGLLVVVVLMILTGRGLVTARQLRDTQADRDHYRKIADDSLAMATKLGMSVEKLTMSVERLTTSAETSNHALIEIQAAVTERRP